MAKKSESNPNHLTDEQIKNIDKYGKQITHIEGTINQIKARASMYIGALGTEAAFTMGREIFQNAVDQLISDISPCNMIKVFYDKRDAKFIITDNGLGVPKEWAVKLFTEAHTGKNLKEKKPGDYSAGTNGIGAKAVNALSIYFDIKTYHYNGTAEHILFEYGELKFNKSIPNKEKLQGTVIEFVPNPEILGPIDLDSGRVYTLVRDILSLLKIGSKIDYTSINEKGKAYHEVMVNEDGIASNIYGKCSSMIMAPVIISEDNGHEKLELSFTFDQEDLGGEDITAYANMCPTSTVPLNSHVSGVLDGICSWFSGYMNKTYLTEKERNKIKINSADIRMGLKLMISAWSLEPIFTGQAKEVFSNVEFKPFAKQVVIDALDKWAKVKPQDLLKCCKFLKDVALARIKADSEKVKITAKYATSASSGLPDKYVRPMSKDISKTELFIVEGDSALGSARGARDTEYQGIFPIRGKILNVFQASPAKIAANTEIAAFINILGAGWGKSFDINKMKVGKIIFLSDADSDGSHIADLLLLVFLKIFPGLVESGRVYKAVPPLYGIPIKNRMEYFAERVDFIRFMQKEYYKKNKVIDAKKKAIDSTVFSRLLIENSDYMYDFKTISERYKLNPTLLEIVLSSHIAKESITTLKKRITSEFRFMTNENITKSGDTIKIKGLIDGRIETLFYNERFITDCEPLIEPLTRAMNKYGIVFYVNGTKMGLFDLVSDAMESIGSVNRYKGLGEMNPDQLRVSTMSPATRTLIQYTVNDINETIKIIRQYDSNKKLILPKIGNIDRGALIGL